MSGRRAKKDAMRKFTLHQLRNDRSRVVGGAKKADGCIIVDENGQRLFSLWIPQEPFTEAE